MHTLHTTMDRNLPTGQLAPRTTATRTSVLSPAPCSGQQPPSPCLPLPP